MLGTSDAWSMSRLSQGPSLLYWRLSDFSCLYPLINYLMPKVGNGNVGAKSTTGNLLGLNTNPMGVTDNPNYSPSTSQQQNRTTTSATASSTTTSTVPPVNIIAENTGWVKYFVIEFWFVTFLEVFLIKSIEPHKNRIKLE